MNTKKSLWIAALAGGLAVGTPEVRTASGQEDVNELDQRIKILERKLEISEEAAATKAKEAPKFTADTKDGFSLSSADKSVQLKFRALVQGDARFFLNDDDKRLNDTFLLRRVRPTLEGSLGPHVGFRVTPDFAGSQSVLFDAYGDLKLSPLANFRVGKSKPPVGLERLQSASDTAFIERGLPTQLVPTRDVGVSYFGSIGTGVVEYSLGVYNGVVDGGNADSDTNDDKDFVGRLYLTPFKNSDIEALQGLSFGVAGSFGDQSGATNAPGLPSFRSNGQQTFFSYRTSTNAAQTAIADGERTRIAPQLYYAVGPVGVLGEYTISEQEVANGKGSDKLQNDSWGVTLSYVLTGENASFKGVQPLIPLDLSKGQWGAVELVGRIGELNVDDDAFAKGYADPARSAKQASNWGAGVNWYLTRNAKLSLNYEKTEFDGGAAKGADRADEEIVFARYQISY